MQAQMGYTKVNGRRKIAGGGVTCKLLLSHICMILQIHHDTLCWGSTGLLTADEASLVEAPCITLDLLCMVHCLLTGCTFGSSSPVWHLQE